MDKLLSILFYSPLDGILLQRHKALVTKVLSVLTIGYTELILSLRVLNLNGMKARCMDQCIPTRLIFGYGSVANLATMKLPG